ncbi:MmpS family transport accessory protein [Actinoplanes sp. N902-109]|uniref:MmpS family transport accessory protein n=1 Tax=Actinoplanes sp. (strain N902-109) TaxID=649831 RepID=UPI0003295971|nr:MmpS family transport accessory protein [Actinoplanes sp. N902-109]AGL14495.1 hypothetical protein L083_0985 [Actinoplanes sp. N902-109]
MSYPPPSDPYRDADPGHTAHYRPGYAPLPSSGPPSTEPADVDPPTQQFPTQQFPPVPPYQQDPYPVPPLPPLPPRSPGGQPGYAEQPPRRNKTPMVIALLAVALLLCAGAITGVVRAFDKPSDQAGADPGPPPVQATEEPEATTPPKTRPTTAPTTRPTTAPTTPPDESDTAATVTVEYEVTGDGPAQILYVDEGGRTPKLTNQSLPWTKKIDVKGVGLASLVVGRAGFSDGELTCVIKVDGKRVARKHSSGTVTGVECSKLLS